MRACGALTSPERLAWLARTKRVLGVSHGEPSKETLRSFRHVRRMRRCGWRLFHDLLARGQFRCASPRDWVREAAPGARQASRRSQIESSGAQCFLRRFAAGASPCLSANWRTGERAGGRRSDSRCLEANCVPQRAGNGCARGPAVEARDTGKLSTRRAAAAPRNASRAREAHRRPSMANCLSAPRNALEPKGTGAP